VRFEKELRCLFLSPAFLWQWRSAGNEGESFIGKVKSTLALHHSLSQLHHHPPLSLFLLLQQTTNPS